MWPATSPPPPVFVHVQLSLSIQCNRMNQINQMNQQHQHTASSGGIINHHQSSNHSSGGELSIKKIEEKEKKEECYNSYTLVGSEARALVHILKASPIFACSVPNLLASSNINRACVCICVCVARTDDVKMAPAGGQKPKYFVGPSALYRRDFTEITYPVENGLGTCMYPIEDVHLHACSVGLGRG